MSKTNVLYCPKCGVHAQFDDGDGVRDPKFIVHCEHQVRFMDAFARQTHTRRGQSDVKGASDEPGAVE